jgi:hypothetical protein
MPKTHSVPALPAAVLAQRMLDVFITNNDAAIDNELQRVLCQTGQAMTGMAATGIESERQELIHAIAMSMNRKRRSRASERREPWFGVWIGLLRHLSDGESVSSSASPACAN